MKKGQGSLEYLLMIAAVIAIAAIVIYLVSGIGNQQKVSVQVSKDKAACSQAGIELVNYNTLLDDPASGDLKVRYINSGDLKCDSSGCAGEVNASQCTIHNSTMAPYTLTVCWKSGVGNYGDMACQVNPQK